MECVYLALGILPDGTRDILGLWIENTEGAKFWMKVFNDLKTRGVTIPTRSRKASRIFQSQYLNRSRLQPKSCSHCAISSQRYRVWVFRRRLEHVLARRLILAVILGHVYEYFLGQFALAEGKKGGQYYTPKSIVTLIVEMLEPFKGRVYDPAMGSGGFFVQSEEFIAQHGGKVANGKTGQISVYGQESNPTTWKLAAMNMAIRGLDFNFGGQPGDTLGYGF